MAKVLDRAGVLSGDRTVDVDGHADTVAVPAERLVGGVVDHFLDDVQRIFGAGVHARALFDRFESLEDADR